MLYISQDSLLVNTNIDIHGLFSKFETFLGERADKTKREKVLSLNALYYVPLTTPRDD